MPTSSNLSSSKLNLSLKGDNINEEVSFPANYFDYDLIARNNDSISQLNFSNADESIAGFVELTPNTADAYLDFFGTHDAVEPANFWKIQGNLAEQKTTYHFTRNHDHTMIDLHFNQPDSFFSDVNRFIHRVDLRGKLSITAPTHWAIFQAQRFPPLQVQGQLIFNGQTYQLVNINTVFRPDIPHQTTEETSYTFYFVHQDQILRLNYQQDNKRSAQKLSITVNGELYEWQYRSHHQIWQETAQQINININSFTLNSTSTPTSSAKITIQLSIPKNHAQLTSHQIPMILLSENSDLLAETYNNEKTYKLSFALPNELLFLSITQIGTGIYNVHYYDTENEEQRCGDDDTSCAGLTINTDQRTFTFNQVQVGHHTFNGTLFIAGVL